MSTEVAAIDVVQDRQPLRHPGGDGELAQAATGRPFRQRRSAGRVVRQRARRGRGARRRDPCAPSSRATVSTTRRSPSRSRSRVARRRSAVDADTYRCGSIDGGSNTQRSGRAPRRTTLLSVAVLMATTTRADPRPKRSRRRTTLRAGPHRQLLAERRHRHRHPCKSADQTQRDGDRIGEPGDEQIDPLGDPARARRRPRRPTSCRARATRPSRRARRRWSDRPPDPGAGR